MVDHIAAHPGRGAGRPLRRTVLDVLGAEADAAGVAISTTAVNHKMADSYRADLPGLVDIGWAFPRVRKLRREPLPAPGAAPSSSTRVS